MPTIGPCAALDSRGSHELDPAFPTWGMGPPSLLTCLGSLSRSRCGTVARHAQVDKPHDACLAIHTFPESTVFSKSATRFGFYAPPGANNSVARDQYSAALPTTSFLPPQEWRINPGSTQHIAHSASERA